MWSETGHSPVHSSSQVGEKEKPKWGGDNLVKFLAVKREVISLEMKKNLF